MLSELQVPQELQVSQLERYDSSLLRREMESALFAIPLGLSRYRYSKETLRAVLDARCTVDGSIQEAARWPTECQVRSTHCTRADVADPSFFLKIYTKPLTHILLRLIHITLAAKRIYASSKYFPSGDSRENSSYRI